MSLAVQTVPSLSCRTDKKVGFIWRRKGAGASGSKIRLTEGRIPQKSRLSVWGFQRAIPLARAETDTAAFGDVSDFSEVDQQAAADDYHRRGDDGDCHDGRRLVLIHPEIYSRRLSADSAGRLFAPDPQRATGH